MGFRQLLSKLNIPRAGAFYGLFDRQWELPLLLVVLTADVLIFSSVLISHTNAACSLLGDGNCDGVVNITDLSILASNFGRTGMGWSQGDFNNDGNVNITDLSILAAHWGLTGGGGTAPVCPGLTSPAFCDNFNNPTVNPASSRSGDLNDTVWGVSRDGLSAFGNQWPGPMSLFALNDGTQTVPSPCNTVTNVLPPHDVNICNGKLHDVVDDGTGVLNLAMYPKQPFDFAGRTGKVVFDVSNNSQGNHAAWPEFWITDQPVPAPFTHEASWTALPRNGLGIRFAGCTDGSGNANTCSQGSPQSIGVDSAITVSNYVENDSFNNGNLQVTGLDSCLASSTPGQMNHYEIDVSQNQIDVYCTNAFSGVLNLSVTPLRHVATIPNANLNFTRGLIWVEDGHYNADKFGNQRINTFTWDNVGFDGPVLPRDLTFDVPNNPALTVGNVNGYSPTYEIGYDIGPNSSTTVTVPNLSSLSSASGGLLTFNFYDNTTEPFAFNYAINGHPHTYAWPFPWTNPNSPKTIGIPISLSDVVNGSNTITFSTGNYEMTVSNIDLIMIGAGGIVSPSIPID